MKHRVRLMLEVLTGILKKIKQRSPDELRRIFGFAEHFTPSYQNFLDTLHADDVYKVQKDIKKALNRNEIYDTEFKIIKPDGDIRNIHARGVAKVDNNGKPTNLIGTTQDITERKQLEEQLRQAQKTEALGVLAGGIAHDFNNILQPILLFSDLLRLEVPADSQGSKDLDQIIRSATRAKDLVSKIQLFSRQGEIVKTPSDIGTVAKEVVGLMQSTLPKSITLEFTSSDDLHPVLCDPSHIHQLLLNICINGAHAIANQGKLKLELSNVELESLPCILGENLSGNHVRVAISDTGTGMDEETLGKIFDPFFTTKGVGEGSGLGLSTALGIVKNFDGGIVVSTELGKGTTFEIFLPIFAGEQKEGPGSQTATGGTESILFVDDEEAITEGWKLQLERFGYDITAISDSCEALRVFRENPGRFALVITDLSMPKMNGDTLIQEMRKCDSEVPVILCTGLEEGLSSETVSAIDINAILSKPLESQELRRVVREVLDGARGLGRDDQVLSN